MLHYYHHVLYEVIFDNFESMQRLRVYATNKKIAKYLWKHSGPNWTCTIERLSKELKDEILNDFYNSPSYQSLFNKYVIDTWERADRIINEL